MKILKKIISLFLILVVIEIGTLSYDTYYYIKDKKCPITTNGKIIARIDNQINFSGMASNND